MVLLFIKNLENITTALHRALDSHSDVIMLRNVNFEKNGRFGREVDGNMFCEFTLKIVIDKYTLYSLGLLYMKFGDLVKKSFVTLISAGSVLYVIWLRLHGTPILKDGPDSNNIIAYIGLLVIFGYVFVNYVIYHFHIKWSRVTLVVLGIALLVFADTRLINDASRMIYIGDIVKILGVIFMIAGPMKLFLSQKKLEQIKESKMEVIEV